MKTFKLHLIRHGLTQGNLDGVFVGGGLDVPLCERGVEELQALRQRFSYPKVGLVFSSPMKRALQTTDILFADVPERLVVEDLRENRFGEFEGRRRADLEGDEDFGRWMDPKSDFVPEGGESGRDFMARTVRGMLAMMNHLMKNEVPAAACVTHGGVIMSMLSQMGMPRKPYPLWMADNGCGFTVQTSAAMLMRDGIVEVTEVLPYGYLESMEAETD